MSVKRSTSQGKTGEKAARKPSPKRDLTKTLYKSDERFKAIFDESPIGLELYDTDGLLIDANPACLRMFGVADIAQVKGFRLFEDPNLPDKAKAKLRRGKTVRYEAPFDFEKVKELRLYETSKSGIVHLDVLITPVGVKRKVAPQGYLVQVQDITERKQTEEALHQYASELAALQATTFDLAAQQDLLSLLDTIVERAMALLDAPCGFIYLYDPKTNELELVIEKGLYASPGLRMQMGEGMAGQVAQTRQFLIVDDYSTWEGRSSQYANTPYHAVIEVPMLFGGQLIGVLGVNEITTSARKYNEADARLLSLLAGQAASAVRNAQLFQGLQSELAERKRTEQALLQAEKRYRILFEQSPDAVVVIDPYTLLPIEFNEKALKLMDCSSEEFSRLSINDYEAIENPQQTRAHVEKVLREGHGEFETRFRTPSGEIKDALVKIQVIELGGKRVFHNIFRDITERKQVEEALRLDRQILANIADGIYLIRASDNVIVYANPRFEEMFGYDSGELIGKHVSVVNAPTEKSPEETAAEISEALNKNGTWAGEVYNIKKDGTPFWCYASVSSFVHTDYGKVWIAIHEDITARKRAEKVREATHRISQAAVSTENLEELYHSIHKVLCELMPVENFYIALYDPSNDLLSFSYFVDQYDPPPQPQKTGRGLTEYVLRTGQPLLAPPEVFDQLVQQGEVELVGTNSIDWLGVPLKVKGQVIGVMVTQSYTEGIRFSQADADLLTFVSTQIAQAIERKRAEEALHESFEKTKQHAERLATLNRITRAISTTLNSDELLEIIYQEITRAIKTEAFFIALYDQSTKELDFRIRVDKGIREPLQQRPLRPGLTAHVITNKQPLLIRNYEQEKDQLPPMILWGTQEAPQSWLGVPILLGDRVTGIISVQAYTPNAYGENEQELLVTIADAVAVAIEKARLYTNLSNEKQRLELLYNLSHHLTESLDSQEVAATALDQICAVLGAFKGVIYVPQPDIGCWELLAMSGMKPAEVKAFNQYPGLPLASGLTGWAASHKKTAVVADVAKDKRWMTIPGLDEWVRSAMSTPLLAGNVLVGMLNLMSEQIAAFRKEDIEIVQAAAASVALALQNARLYAAEKRRSERFAEIAKLGIELASMHEASTVLKFLVGRATAIMESATCTVMLIDSATDEAVLAAQTGLPEGTPPELRVPLELPILRHSMETSQPIIIPDIDHDAPAMRTVLVRQDVRAFFAYPLIREGRTTGFITFSKLTVHTPSPEENAACQLLAERAAVALENARLFEETARSLRQVQALHTIDLTIASSFDLRLTLNIFLEQAMAQLNLDAVDMLVYNPRTQMLDYAAGIGFRTTALQGTHLRLGQGYAGIAGLERKTIHVSNLLGHKTDFLRSPYFNAEEFDTYFGVPLIAKGQVKGVMEVFHRSPLHPNQNWMDFLETLAKQAAIAIDNATLFSDLQSTNAELILAYDTTLTGWSKALDLRDRETEGHTQRVVETTIMLARAMGVPEADLPNMRRGALLHDIGKMGVPDNILHKPGPLTTEDWLTMRRHPVYAREMLQPITYLQSATDIPYYHHEKWDGSGYPNGMKGEQIPLAARIFAVVDVFDALTSDRPYRSAWPREKALEYIREQASKYFDLKVVETFLRMVGNG